MSIQAVAWVLEQTIPDQGAKLVLISLANAYNAKSGRCFPSIEQIMVEASCSRATVKRKLSWLAEHGWIASENTFDRTGRQLSNSYTIRFHSGHEGGVQIEPDGGLNLNPRGITGEPPGGLNCEPPLKEPEEIPEEGSLSETSSDHPQKPKKGKSYPEGFEAFWQAYPRTPNMSKSEAFTAWRKLDDDDRAACLTAIPAYVAFLKAKPDLETIHACRFISKRRFDGFAAGAVAAAKRDDSQWPKRLAYARQNNTWSTSQWGPPPGLPGCRVPVELLRDGDGTNWREWEQAA
jgi:hypothetical protein